MDPNVAAASEKDVAESNMSDVAGGSDSDSVVEIQTGVHPWNLSTGQDQTPNFNELNLVSNNPPVTQRSNASANMSPRAESWAPSDWDAASSNVPATEGTQESWGARGWEQSDHWDGPSDHQSAHSSEHWEGRGENRSERASDWTWNNSAWTQECSLTSGHTWPGWVEPRL